jgi:hypothetical protein
MIHSSRPILCFFSSMLIIPDSWPPHTRLPANSMQMFALGTLPPGDCKKVLHMDQDVVKKLDSSIQHQLQLKCTLAVV